MLERFIICDRCALRVQLGPDTEPSDASFYGVHISVNYGELLPAAFARGDCFEHWCLKCMETHGVVKRKQPEPAPPMPEPKTDAGRNSVVKANAVDFA